MKKLIYVAVCGILGSAGTANAQETRADYAFNSAIVKATTDAGSTAVAISERAVKNFNRSYPGKTDVNWYAIKDGYVARFNSPQITRNYYDRKGNWKVTQKDYGPEMMPDQLRRSVKNAFPEYVISWTNEITTPEQLIYLVHLQGMFTLKTLKVCNDEMDVIETIDK